METTPFVKAFDTVFLKPLQTLHQFDCPHRYTFADFIKRVLIDPTANEFAVGNFLDPCRVPRSFGVFARGGCMDQSRSSSLVLTA